MSEMHTPKKHLPIEQTQVFETFRMVSNEVWLLVQAWDRYGQHTVGFQLTRALDSVTANLAEGDGRYSDAEALHFFAIARGSAREARNWILLASDRGLIVAEKATAFSQRIEHGLQMLNGLMNYRRKTKNKNIVKETQATYGDSETLTPNA